MVGLVEQTYETHEYSLEKNTENSTEIEKISF